MLVMFGVFSALFYKDGSTGYREKNYEFYLHKTFQRANNDFSRMNQNGQLQPTEWKSFAATQTVDFPEDRSVLPASLKLPMSWPDILHDFEKMKPLQWNILWREYSKNEGLDAEPKEEPFNAKKIREQWIVLWICLALTLGAAFFLIRTLRRSIRLEGATVTSQNGKRVPISEMKSLDLRKWNTKGLAFIDYDGPSGKGRLRIDGLTYGGFKKEQGQPAEQLMQGIRDQFNGEIIEYTAVEPEAPPTEESPAEEPPRS